MRRKVLGNDDSRILDTMEQLAWVLQSQHKLLEAEMLYQEMLMAARKAWTNSPLRLKAAMDNLAAVFEQDDKRAEAEPLLLEGNALLQSSDQVSDKEKREAMEGLWRFYAAWAVAAPNTGKIQKSMEWSEKLAQFDKALKEKKQPNSP